MWTLTTLSLSWERRRPPPLSGRNSSGTSWPLIPGENLEYQIYFALKWTKPSHIHPSRQSDEVQDKLGRQWRGHRELWECSSQAWSQPAFWQLSGASGASYHTISLFSVHGHSPEINQWFDSGGSHGDWMNPEGQHFHSVIKLDKSLPFKKWIPVLLKSDQWKHDH